MLLGAKIEIEKMREGWVEGCSGYAFLHAYLTHSHMLEMVISSRVTRQPRRQGKPHKRFGPKVPRRIYRRMGYGNDTQGLFFVWRNQLYSSQRPDSVLLRNALYLAAVHG